MLTYKDAEMAKFEVGCLCKPYELERKEKCDLSLTLPL